MIGGRAALAAYRGAMAAAGLDLVGAVPAATARTAIAPGATLGALRGGGVRSVVLCGSGGRAHWEALAAADWARPHPIAESSAAAAAAALPLLGPGARLATAAETGALDLRRLAEHAGFGTLSPYLLLVIHPVYGPWISLRAVVLVRRRLPYATRLRYDPCGPCARPCLDACPAGAYRSGLPWSFARCADHRLAEPLPERHCADGCHSRSACPVGLEHRYSRDEYRHRHRAGLADLRRLRCGD